MCDVRTIQSHTNILRGAKFRLDAIQNAEEYIRGDAANIEKIQSNEKYILNIRENQK